MARLAKDRAGKDGMMQTVRLDIGSGDVNVSVSA